MNDAAEIIHGLSVSDYKKCKYRIMPDVGNGMVVAKHLNNGFFKKMVQGFSSIDQAAKFIRETYPHKKAPILVESIDGEFSLHN